MIPDGSVVHPAILSSLSSWDYFPMSKDIHSSANVGGFGIDGCMSTLIGASFATNKLCFCITGDLAFFYDMNSLGCREIGSNVRILLINNNLGMTFKLSNHVGSQRVRGRSLLDSSTYVHLRKTNSMLLKSALYRRMQRSLFCSNVLRVKRTKEMQGISSIPLMIVSIQKQGLKK